MDPVELVGKAVEQAHSASDADERIRSILKILADGLGFEVTTLYSFDAGARTFHPEHSNVGPGFVKGSGDFFMGQGMVGACGATRTTLCIEGAEGRDAITSRWGEDFQGYTFILAVPLVHGGTLTGVLVVLRGESRQMSTQEVRVLDLIAAVLAGLMINSTLDRDLRSRLHELSALSEISRAVGSTLELEPLMDMMVQTSIRVMNAKGGALRILDEEARVYRVTSVFGGDIHRQQELRSGPQSDCEVVRTGSPYMLRDSVHGGACWAEMGYDVASCLCVPLSYEGRTLGVLSVYEKVADSRPTDERFSPQDIALLQTMAGFMASAITRAMHHRRIQRLAADKENMVRELSILHATSAAMMRTIDMDRLLQVILVALTLGDGLGFNRAMLFLVDEGEAVLAGKVGVGPASAAEAGRVWTELSGAGWTLSQWLEWTLEQDKARTEESAIQRATRSIRIPLTNEDCSLIRALKETRAFRVDPKTEMHGTAFPRSLELGKEFCVASVVARGEALGVIVVDNIYSERPIQEEDLRFLSAFASQAGLAIQNAMFYEGLRKAHKELQSMQQRLVQSEKLAALGEFAATMAHEIRNPLVSIGGYARLVQKRHRDAYSQIIYEEVGRLEGILNRILAFSKATPGDRSDEEIGGLLEEILRVMRADLDQKGVRVRKEWTQSLPIVHCDREQIKQVFLNLFQNAVEAMGPRGTFTLRTFLSSEEDGLWVVAEVADTGGGIPAHILPNIFNPFFTTKERGTGLGLAITRRIVEAHGGKIEVDNHPGEGSTFRVKLPASF
jgi:two-component system, NtrC family, sensor histidine kinase HydH